MKMIYADYNGSAPLLPEVKRHIEKRMKTTLFGNPNALHQVGQKILTLMTKSRETIAESLGCHPDQIIFNSGASEGISHIISHLLHLHLSSDESTEKKIIITSSIEHKIVHHVLDHFKKRYHFEILTIDPDSQGKIQFNDVKNIIEKHSQKIALVSIMAANNETGVIQEFEKMQSLCHEKNVPFFSDTTQLIGKHSFDFQKSQLDFAVCSGHKLGALPGTGFLIVKNPEQLTPYIFGTGQERGLRGGTQNYLGIESLGIALHTLKKNLHHFETLKKSKQLFEKKLTEQIPEIIIFGRQVERLAGTTLLSCPSLHGQALQIELESRNIFVTTSAACSDNEPDTSQVLKAMKIDDAIGRGVLRISLSYSQGTQEYDKIKESLYESYGRLKKINAL